MFRMLRTRAPARWIASGAALCALLMSVAEAQGFNVVIREGSEARTPIAVVPFGWQGSGPPPFDIAGVVSNDLAMSGRFEPMTTAQMPQRPSQAAQVDFPQWLRADAAYLVIGTLVENSADNFTARFQLFDVVRATPLTEFRYQATRAELRRTAHRLADRVFEELTGFRGVFDTQIAYVIEEPRADGSKLFHLMVSDADGENARSAHRSTQPVLSPTWSPDSRRIAYVWFENGVSGVYVQTLRTGTRERVSARAGVNSAPTFSPDGRMLALVLSRDTGNLDIHTLDLSTQVLRQLTTDAGIDTEPEWSPDGRTIYFNSDRSGGPQIYRVGTEAGQRAQRITFDCVYCARPRVSPDGKFIALVNGENNRYRIAAWDIEAERLNLLTPDGRLDESPSFAPNGAQIVYASKAANGRGVLASVTTDGRFRTELASAGDVREPVWGPFRSPE